MLIARLLARANCEPHSLHAQVMHCAQEWTINLSYIMVSTMEKSLKNPRETV